MSKLDTLFGVVIGATIVGTTLVVKEVMDDPEKAAAIRAGIKSGCEKVKNKAVEIGTVVRTKVSEGYALVREKAGETGTAIREKVENARPVQKIKEAVDGIRRKAEPAAPYFAEGDEDLDPTPEAIEETPVAEGDEA